MHTEESLTLSMGTLGIKLAFNAAPGRVDGRTTRHKRATHPLDFPANNTCTAIAIPTCSMWQRLASLIAGIWDGNGHLSRNSLSSFELGIAIAIGETPLVTAMNAFFGTPQETLEPVGSIRGPRKGTTTS